MEMRYTEVRTYWKYLHLGTCQHNEYMETVVTVFQAYCFCGENLLGQDHCGEAIRALQESQACE